MRESAGLPQTFTMWATDWNDSHSQKVAYTMYTDDVWLTIMFFRIYFLIMALTMLTPTNSDLFAKRLAQEHGFESGFMYQLKVNLARRAALTVGFICFFGVTFFAYEIMIWERPYWTEQGTLTFSNIFTSVWYVIISMSTVGYGGIVASTVPGRIIAIICILFGAFILSLIVSVIATGFELGDDQAESIVTITEKKSAIKAVIASLRYNAKRNIRYRLKDEAEFNDGDLQSDMSLYCPTPKECIAARKQMESAVEVWKQEKNANTNMDEKIPRDSEIKMLKNRLVDMNDKFDLLLYSLLS
jgi:hypothetical protein